MKTVEQIAFAHLLANPLGLSLRELATLMDTPKTAACSLLYRLRRKGFARMVGHTFRCRNFAVGTEGPPDVYIKGVHVKSLDNLRKGWVRAHEQAKEKQVQLKQIQPVVHYEPATELERCWIHSASRVDKRSANAENLRAQVRPEQTQGADE